MLADVPTVANTASSDTSSRATRYVEYIIRRCKEDKGIRAALSRADNPATEHQSWEVLASFGINLEWANECLPFALIAAALARTKAEKNGSIALGRAIARCYDEDRESNQARARLRRILACDNVPELCLILRNLLRLMESRGESPDYAQLLKDLLNFGHEGRQREIKSRWAKQFYQPTTSENDPKML
jgi:CRISPR system Cascade subunit CasB